MKIYIKTWGCQANISDSEAMAGILKEKGHQIINNENGADLILVNTCSVKDKTQSKELHYIREKSKNKKIIVGGCLTKTINIRNYIPEVTAVFDTTSILKINEIVETQKDHFSNTKELSRLEVPIIRKNKEIAIIPISQGCLNNCNFCSTKLSRGNLISYRIGDVKRALEKSINEGCNKVFLTSQDNGCYGFDIKTNLPELLNELTKVKGNYKIRVGMANPWHVIKIIDSLIESYKNEKIMKFIHIPLQSGSENVLKDMKRIHSVKDFKNIVNKFRNEFKNITISTDIIVGYPTETKEDFQETLNVINELKPEVLNISKYSIRPNTEALKLKQTPSQEIKRRSTIITNLYNNYRKKEKIK